MTTMGKPQLCNCPPERQVLMSFPTSEPWELGMCGACQKLNPDKTTDGYHSISSLYAHRHALFIALCNTLDDRNIHSSPVKSKLHHNGTMFEGFFIAGMKLKNGWISYHLPIHLWDLLHIPEVDRFQKWDGHVSENVIGRLIAHFAPNE